jgi:hypothetical protein
VPGERGADALRLPAEQAAWMRQQEAASRQPR